MSKPNTARRTDGCKRTSTQRARPSIPDHEVLRRLYQLLEESEPSVAVSSDFVAITRGVIDAIIDGGRIDPQPLAWVLIFHEIHWRRDSPRYYAPCGVELVKFMGCLGQSLWEQQVFQVSVAKAIELMIGFQDVTYLKFGHSGARWWIESTPEGVEAFGYPVHIDLPRPPQVSGPWPLESFESLAGDEPDGDG